jgi:hypothetical protein
VNVTDLRAAVTLNGGTPASYDRIALLRQLVTAYGGTPTQYSIVGLLREAVTAVGGTPASWSTIPLLRELLTALGVSTFSYDGRVLSGLIAVTGGSVAPINTAVPAISGTGSPGQTLTRTAGTWTGADSVSGQWRKDSVAISGQTASTYVVQSGDAGTFIDYYEDAVKGATHAYKGSNGIAIAAAVSTDGTYDGKNNTAGTVGGVAPGGTFADGTAIGTAYPDLTLSGTTAQMTVNASAQLQFGGTSAGDTMLKTAGGADWIASWKVSDGGFSPPRFVWDRADGSNYRYLEILLGDNGYTPHTVTAGSDSAGTFVSFGANVAQGNTIEVSRSGSSMSLKRNGATVGSGWTAARVNDVVGWRSRSGGERWDDWVLQSASNPISISSATVDNDGYFAIAGSYGTPTPTTIEIRRFTSDGTLASNWETCTGMISGGTYSVVSATKASAAVQGANARVQVRASNNTSVERSTLVAVPLFQSVFAFEKGMNETNPSFPGVEYGRDFLKSAIYGANSYTSVYVEKGRVGGLRADGVTMIADSDSGIGYDGAIQSYGSGNSLIRVFVPNRLPATGSYTLTFPAAMTPSLSLGSHGSVTGSGSGTRTINFTDASWPVNDVTFEFSGGTDGSLNFKPTLTRVGDANPSRPYSDAVLASWAAGGATWIRNMDPSACNLDTVARTDFSTQQWTGPVSMGASPLSYQVAFANAANTHIGLNISHMWSDAYIAGYAQYVAQNLSATLMCGPEFSNEVWNRVTFSQGNDLGVQACQEGLWNTLGNATPITIRTGGIDVGSGPYYGSTNGDLTTSFASGDYLYANFGGWQVFRALKANVAGSSDNLANGSAWTIAITGAEVTRALKRKYAQRAKAMFDIFDAAFVAAGYSARSRVRRRLAWQASTGYTDAQEILSWQDTYQSYDEFLIGPYWGGGFAGYDLGTYDSNYPGWGATEKALVATNVPAFLDAFFAIAPTAIDAAVDATRDYKQGLARWLNTTYGLAMDARLFGAYEAHWHWITLGGWNAAISTVFPTIVADARFATMFTRFVNGYKAKVGGNMNLYVRSQGPWSALPSYNWGFQESEADTSNALFTAFAAA